MVGFAQKHKIGRETAGNSLAGHLAGFQNNAHPKWWRDPGLRKLHLGDLFLCSGARSRVLISVAIVLVIFSSIVDGYDASLSEMFCPARCRHPCLPIAVNNLQALPTWLASLGHPDANMLGIFGAMQVVGSFIAALPMPYIMDHWGRRWTLCIGGMVCVVGGLIQAFSYSQAQYIVGRMVVGGSQSFQLVGGNIMISELAHPRIRYKIVGFYQVHRHR
jgi:hypothetical protein